MSWISELRKHMKAHGVEARGVLHIGAHQGEEVYKYQQCGFKRIVCVEPQEDKAAYIRKKHPNVEVVPRAVSSIPGFAEMFVTDNTKRSSLLEPRADVVGQEVIKTTNVTTCTLRELQADDVNVLVIDAQGSELDVLESGDPDHFDLIVVEVREQPQYFRQPTPYAVDHWLGKIYEFKLIKTWKSKKNLIEDRLYIHHNLFMTTDKPA